MSIPFLNAAWKCHLPKPATAMTKLVLVKLADHADQDGYCYPSVERICEDTEMGKSTVLRHMLYLESAGIIRRQPGHTGRSTSYTLHLAAIQATEAAHAPEGKVPQRDVSAEGKSRNGTYRVPQGDSIGPAERPDRSRSGTPSLMEPPLNHHRTPKGDSFLSLPFNTPEFTQAWNDWQTHQKERRQKATPTTQRLQLAMLSDMGEKRALATLRHSTASGYTGLYEPKQALSRPRPDSPSRPAKYHADAIL